MAKISGFDKLPALLPAILLAACGTARPPPCAAPAPPGPLAWVVDQGWHTEIGLPAQQLLGPLSVFREIFPGATVLMFGFGKRTWMTANVESPSELIMGPFPGPGAIQVVGIRWAPLIAYPDSQVTRLSLDFEQQARLSAFLWNSLGKTRHDTPRLISRGLFPGSLFYAASRPYGPGYTCNSWTAQGLQQAGLPVRADGVMFAAGLLEQTARLQQACRLR